VRQKKTSFHLQPGFDESGLSKDEFLLIQDTFFYRDTLPDNYEPASQVLEWKLKPDALFGYLSYKQYEHAICSATKAQWIAGISLAVALIGLGVAII
jgi:hypothetical protein